jgi:hypothetical protein
VFITDTSTSQILEFAHGGTTPINTLSDYDYQPVSCAVDPKSGNLAVTSGGLGLPQFRFQGVRRGSGGTISASTFFRSARGISFSGSLRFTHKIVARQVPA